jgi:hypothetical protein
MISADVISDGEIEDLLSKANEFHKLVEASFDWEAILSPKPSRPVAVLNAYDQDRRRDIYDRRRLAP